MTEVQFAFKPMNKTAFERSIAASDLDGDNIGKSTPVLEDGGIKRIGSG